MKEKIKFNINKLNTDIFDSEIDLDEFLDKPQDEELVLEECKKYDQLEYSIKLNKVSESTGDCWVAEHPSLPGCITHGETKLEALINLEDAKKSWVYAKISAGESIPEPSIEQDFRDASGKILLRLPKELHYRISQEAKANSVSINQQLIYLMSHALGEVSMSRSVIGKLDDIQNILRQSIGSKKNIDIGREYSKFIGEFRRQLTRDFKTPSTELFYEDNPLVFEKPKKVFNHQSQSGFN